MEFRILGPVEFWTDGQRHELGSPRERCIFACLALMPNKPVPIDTLIDRLWGGRVTSKTRQTLYSYKNRLDKRISALSGGRARIRSRDHGYVLEVDDELIDLHRFFRLRDQGVSLAHSGLVEQSSELLRQARDSWHGEPLANLTAEWTERVRGELMDQWLEATRVRIRIELRLCRFGEVITELRHLVVIYPYDEILAEYLIRAFHGCGRSAEALAFYEQQRIRLVEDLGADPRPELRELHQELLNGSVTPLDPPQYGGQGQSNNLKRDVPEFTGRAEEIGAIIGSLPAPGSGCAAPVQSIHGMPGVGKTALAIHIANCLTDRYPDAQLFVDLHGHEPSDEFGRSPTAPAIALSRLLQLLGVPPAQIPERHDDRAELWRSRMASRRAIVILDNAAGGEQVRDLFPGGPDCLVIVTSRVRLSSLPGVRSCPLDTLPSHDGARLFSAVADEASRTADHEAVAEIARLCGGLPLAIRIVAARLKDRANRTARDLANRLARDGGRLGELRSGDVAVRSAFDSSYHDLRADQRRAFRRLGLHFGEEFTIYAAAALLDVRTAEADRILDDLIERHLLEESGRERFRFHDLLREYACERSRTEDAEPDRHSINSRLVQYYVDTAASADHVMQPYRDLGASGSAEIEIPEMLTFPEACVRLDLESSGMIYVAQEYNMDAPDIAHFLAYYLDLKNYWNVALEIHRKALVAWRNREDREGETQCLLDVILIHLRLSHYPEALRLARDVLDVARARGDLPHEAAALDRIGLADWHTAKLDEALRCFDDATVVYQNLGDQKGIAEVLVHSATVLLGLRSYDICLARYRRARSLYRAIGDRRGEGHALIGIGEVYRNRRRYDDALLAYESAAPLVDETMGPLERAILRGDIAYVWQRQGWSERALDACRDVLSTYRAIGDRLGEAEIMNEIGIALAALGRLYEALIHHQRARSTAHEIGDLAEEYRGLRCMGDLRFESGSVEKALNHYRSASDVADRLGRPYERGCARMGVGRALRTLRGEAAARPYLEEAIALLDALGVDEADTARDALGAPKATGT